MKAGFYWAPWYLSTLWNLADVTSAMIVLSFLVIKSRGLRPRRGFHEANRIFLSRCFCFLFLFFFGNLAPSASHGMFESETGFCVLYGVVSVSVFASVSASASVSVSAFVSVSVSASVSVSVSVSVFVFVSVSVSVFASVYSSASVSTILGT